MTSRKDSFIRLLIITIIVLAIVSVGALGFVYYRKKGNVNNGGGANNNSNQESNIKDDDNNSGSDEPIVPDVPIIPDEPENKDGYLNDASIYEYIKIGDNYFITGFKDTGLNFNGNLILPTETTLGGRVVGVATNAFCVYGDDANAKIKRVVVPASYMVVGKNAFKNSNIEELYLGLEVDGNVVTRPTKTYKLQVSNNAFTDCKKLNKIEIYKSVLSVGENAFAGATAVYEMIIESGEVLKNIDNNFFGISTTHNIELLVERKIDASKSATISQLFRLIDIKYNRNVRMNRYMLKEHSEKVFVVVGNTVVGLSDFAIVNQIENMIINSETTGIYGKNGDALADIAIADGAFSGNNYVKSVVFENANVEIMRDAFNGCKNLSTLEFDTEQFTIRKNAFVGCDSLKAVKVLKNNTLLVMRKLANGGYGGDYSIMVDKKESYELIKLLIEDNTENYYYNEFCTIVG